MPFTFFMRKIDFHFPAYLGIGVQYISFQPNLCYDESEPQIIPDRALDGSWNVGKSGPKYIMLSTDFSDEFWHKN